MKSTIEIARERVTIYGYHLCLSERDPASMTGRTGRTQGARIVRIHAMNDMNASVNIIYILEICVYCMEIH